MVAPRALEQHRLIGIDTTVFVYAFDAHPEFGAACEAVLRSVEAGRVEAVMSTLVLSELLVRPFRLSRMDVAARYVDALARHPHLVQVPADGPICQLAAKLRGQVPALRLPDAVHMATALAKGATALVSNDARLPATTGLAILRPTGS